MHRRAQQGHQHTTIARSCDARPSARRAHTRNTNRVEQRPDFKRGALPRALPLDADLDRASCIRRRHSRDHRRLRHAHAPRKLERAHISFRPNHQRERAITHRNGPIDLHAQILQHALCRHGQRRHQGGRERRVIKLDLRLHGHARRSICYYGGLRRVEAGRNFLPPAAGPDRQALSALEHEVLEAPLIALEGDHARGPRRVDLRARKVERDRGWPDRPARAAVIADQHIRVEEAPGLHLLEDLRHALRARCSQRRVQQRALKSPTHHRDRQRPRIATRLGLRLTRQLHRAIQLHAPRRRSIARDRPLEPLEVQPELTILLAEDQRTHRRIDRSAAITNPHTEPHHL